MFVCDQITEPDGDNFFNSLGEPLIMYVFPNASPAASPIEILLIPPVKLQILFPFKSILEYPLMFKHHIDIKFRSHYSVASVMVYNKNCRQFIAENNWMNNLAFNMHIDDIKYYYPFSDETTINVLLWKYGHKNRLPLMQMNIDDIGNVKELYESKMESIKKNFELDHIVIYKII